MIKVDSLEHAPEMSELIEREKRGEITMEQMREALDKHRAFSRTVSMGGPGVWGVRCGVLWDMIYFR